MADGFHDFAAAEVLTAANVDDYLMRQTVMRFASAAARDSALSGVLVEGLVAYLKDVDTVTMYTGSSWVTAYHIAAWSTYTPVVLQADGTPCTVTVTTARFIRQGRSISGTNILSITGAGSATNGEAINVSMPVTPLDTSGLEIVGAGYVYDVTVASYPALILNFASTFRFKRADATSSQHIGEDPGFALANGDSISFNYQYESS